jgi:hypothetical protein
MATPNMGLDLPVVGPSGTAGPTYANMNNAAITLVDSHDHTTGKGVKVTPAGINVNQNFSFSGFGITSLNYAKLVDNTVNVSDFTSVFAKNGDLYWFNAAGNAVQITSGSTVNVSSAGGIGGDYTTSTASVTYSDTTKTYTFTQSPGITGDIAGGSLYIYENISSGKYAKFQVPAGLAANYNLTLPAALPAVKSILALSASGTVSADGDTLLPKSTLDVNNYTLSASVAANALTIALKTLAGTDASASDIASISFRSDTATSGSFVQRNITSALSLVVSSGSTLGHSSATAQYIYVYALDNAGTVELAVSSTLFNDRVVQSSSAEGGAGGADTSSVLYSTTARTSKAIRLIGRLTSNQTTAGTWAAAPTAVTLMPDNPEPKNYVISSSSGSFSTTSASDVDVTNLTATIVTSGRPVIVSIIGDGTSSSSSLEAFKAATTTAQILIKVLRDGAVISHSIISSGGASGTISCIIPAGLSLVFDAVSAGKYVYKIQASTVSTTTANLTRLRLLVYEV